MGILAALMVLAGCDRVRDPRTPAAAPEAVVQASAAADQEVEIALDFQE